MKMKHYDRCELFVCDCSDTSHNVIFQLWDWGDGDPPDLNINVELNHYLGFWKRLWLAVKYTFGYLSRYGHYDTMSVRYEDVPRMKAILDEYVRKTDEIVEKDISVIN